MIEIQTEKKEHECLVVIDGNHLIHRAFYAIQNPLKTSSGEQTNALYGFASMLLNILDAEKPDYIAMTFDEKAPTFRHDKHEGYKATRTKAPDELYAQIPRVHEMIHRFKIPVFSQEGFEADDMMGTLAKKAEKKGIVTHIITGDMDLLQLVNPNITVVFPLKGYREPLYYNAEKVVEKYGIEPEQVVDYKALVGDTSDNIKGVDGIGPKGASEMLKRFQTLDGVYEHLNDLSEGHRQKLIADKEAAYFAHDLARIRTDVECDFKPEDARLSQLDYLGLLRFFEEMEMKSLVSRLKKIIPQNKLQPEAQLSIF